MRFFLSLFNRFYIKNLKGYLILISNLKLGDQNYYVFYSPIFKIEVGIVISNSLKETIKVAIKNNLSIIPVTENKIPIIKWKKYQYQKADNNTISEWFKNIDKARGIALVTGNINNILVLDIDLKKGKNGFKHLKNKKLPLTLSSKTKNNGKHYFYRLPKNETFSSVTNLFTGVDIKCEGGFVVIPETPGYEWCTGMDLNNIDLLAEVPDWLKIELYKKKKKACVKSNSSNLIQTEILPVKVKKSTTKKNQTEQKFIKYFQQEEVIFKIMKLLGINTAIDKPFKCILPSKVPDTRPSASIIQGDNEVFVYRDWREEQFYTFAEVYASIKYKQKKKLRKAEEATWGLRILLELKIVEIKIPKHMQIKSLSRSLNNKITVKKVYEGFIELIMLKKVYNEKQEATAFSYRFASAWCDVSIESARKAIILLQQEKYIEAVGKSGSGIYKVNTYKLK